MNWFDRWMKEHGYWLLVVGPWLFLMILVVFFGKEF